MARITDEPATRVPTPAERALIAVSIGRAERTVTRAYRAKPIESTTRLAIEQVAQSMGLAPPPRPAASHPQSEPTP